MGDKQYHKTILKFLSKQILLSTGLSIDASGFFKPRTNSDGSLSGAAGTGYGPPTMGPGFMPNNNNNNANNSNDSNGNSNNYNNMFGPPNFFMSPGATFGGNSK